MRGSIPFYAYEGLTPLASCSHPFGVKNYCYVTILCGLKQRFEYFPYVVDDNIISFCGRMDPVLLVELWVPPYAIQEKGNERDVQLP